ncbi:hypothetical protein BLNAU_16779 [Blattamonas nauphoetae]|uniref:Uncharacterized protein n=1 Tax=Blattamonas nauphoetae TaxID=2049346 RepID=A0ABQ9XAS3_9EUKA|nr:hypothetical protein BLNAU_16779 [Blattamonas nauphoetae]
MVRTKRTPQELLRLYPTPLSEKRANLIRPKALWETARDLNLAQSSHALTDRSQRQHTVTLTPKNDSRDTRLTPLISIVIFSLIADSNRPDAKTAMTQFSSWIGMNGVRSLLILKQRSKEMFEMKITLVDDDLGASGSDHGDMNESGATAEHAFVLLVSFVITRIKRNKGKIRLPQPSANNPLHQLKDLHFLPPSSTFLASHLQTSLTPTLTSSPKKKINEVEEKLVNLINQIELTGGSIFRLWEMCLNETEPGVLFMSVEEVDSEEGEEHDEEEKMIAEFNAQAVELFLKITEEEEKRMIEEREKEKDHQQSDEEDRCRREQLKQERLERKRSQEGRKQKLEKKRKIAELTSQLMLMEKEEEQHQQIEANEKKKRIQKPSPQQQSISDAPAQDQQPEERTTRKKRQERRNSKE